MRLFIFSLCMLFLLSACATTGVNTANELQVNSDSYQGAPPGSTLKCQCGSSFSVDDVYFP